VSGQKWGSSIDFDRRPYNRSALPCCLWCNVKCMSRESRVKFISPMHFHYTILVRFI